jgi:transcriptional regulator with XRE-family HTH domain
MDGRESRQVLARRLRALREEHWPDMKVTQAQLARALGSSGKPVSVPLISSWESRRNPTVLPAFRLQDYATFFATPRSLEGENGRLLRLEEMTEEEQAARHQLAQELTRLRDDAAASGDPALDELAISGLAARGRTTPEEIARSLRSGPWHFADGQPVTIVCAQLPQDMLDQIPYASRDNPQYIEMYEYSDLDALFELYGHLRAANPTSQINLRPAPQLQRDHYADHLVALGGVDWNRATRRVSDRLQIPVRQVPDWDAPEGAYIEVSEEDGRKVPYRPVLDKVDGQETLREDIALFARAVNPYNQKRTVTICTGMYSAGGYGIVRALTDINFRDRNAEYLRERFASAGAYCILTRVIVENGEALTPDWTLADTRLFEWPRSL